jgi:hypothetical protein
MSRTVLPSSQLLNRGSGGNLQGKHTVVSHKAGRSGHEREEENGDERIRIYASLSKRVSQHQGPFFIPPSSAPFVIKVHEIMITEWTDALGMLGDFVCNYEIKSQVMNPFEVEKKNDKISQRFLLRSIISVTPTRARRLRSNWHS